LELSTARQEAIGMCALNAARPSLPNSKINLEQLQTTKYVDAKKQQTLKKFVTLVKGYVKLESL
jgi:hypothetical protein